MPRLCHPGLRRLQRSRRKTSNRGGRRARPAEATGPLCGLRIERASQHKRTFSRSVCDCGALSIRERPANAGRQSLCFVCPSWLRAFVVAFVLLRARQDEAHFYSRAKAGAPRALRLNVYSKNPAMVAVMKFASVPANIARSPRRARSWRRLGASAPMPPIWMPMELKFANPQSAKVAMVNDFGSIDAFIG